MTEDSRVGERKTPLAGVFRLVLYGNTIPCLKRSNE
jgi:hypothetical protein